MNCISPNFGMALAYAGKKTEHDRGDADVDREARRLQKDLPGSKVLTVLSEDETVRYIFVGNGNELEKFEWAKTTKDQIMGGLLIQAGLEEGASRAKLDGIEDSFQRALRGIAAKAGYSIDAL